jgi:hypothetical protein
MTIEEITAAIRRQTYGLLNDGEVVYATELALTAHGGIDPDDVTDVDVVFGKSSMDIQLMMREQPLVIDLA